MITKMKKYDLKDLKMNGKKFSIVCLTALFSLSGCAMFSTNGSQDEIPTDENELICQGVDCETDPFVNYTQTRAEFKEDGELSPRDSLISQAGAGNNLSSAVPPSIESEVISYEEQVENADSEDETVLADNNEAEQEDIEQTSNQQVAENASDTSASNETSTDVAGNDTKSDEAESVAQNEASQEKETEQAKEEKQEQEFAQDEEEDPVRDWYAEEGQNLKALLTEWSTDSGWRLVWNTNRNYVLNAGAMFRGRFADVSSALIRAFARARPAPVATFYKGNRVLVVETMEDENAYD